MARKRVKQGVCANCNYPFREGENYCSNCGQENHSPNQPITHYFSELAESLLHLDSKFFSTIYQLIRFPGKVSIEYSENKRNRFMPPIRLYVFISFVFFLMVQWQTGDKENDGSRPGLSIKDSDGNKTKIEQINEDSLEIKTEDADGKTNLSLFGYNLKFDARSLKKFKNPTASQIDSIIISQGEHPDYFSRTITRQFIKSVGDTENFKLHFIQKLYKLGSMSLFLLMPIFAILLKLLHFTRKKYYYEYLIFSIHYHSYCFLILTLLLLINMLIGVPAIFFFLAFILFMVYLAIAIKRAYPQSRRKAIAKSFVLYFSYGFILIVFIILILFLSLWVA